MRIVYCQDTAFYRPRQPGDSPLYQLVEQHCEAFEQAYPDRFQAQIRGLWCAVATQGEGGCREGKPFARANTAAAQLVAG